MKLKSTSSVHSHLSALEEKGYIHRDPTKPRAIEILDDTFNFNRKEMVNIPVIGTVAAGEPILAEEHIESYFPFPAESLPNAETFMLHVKGESMVNAGILPGDQLIVNSVQLLKMGDRGCPFRRLRYCKTFLQGKDHYRLQPENDTMDPIITDHVDILGKVIGLIRMM